MEYPYLPEVSNYPKPKTAPTTFNHQDEVALFKRKIHDLEMELSDTKNELKNQKKQNRFLENGVETLMAQMDSITSRTVQHYPFANEIEMRDEFERLHNQVRVQHVQIEWLTQSNNELQERLVAKESEKNVLSAKVFNLKNKIVMTENDNESLRETVGLLQNRVIDLTETMKAASHKMTALKEKVNTLSTDMGSYANDKGQYNDNELVFGNYHQFITNFFENINTFSGQPVFKLNNYLSMEGINDYQFQVSEIIKHKNELEMKYLSVSKELETVISDNENLGQIIKRQVDHKMELEQLLEKEKFTIQSFFSRFSKLTKNQNEPNADAISDDDLRNVVLNLISDNIVLLTTIDKMKNENGSQENIDIKQLTERFIDQTAALNEHLKVQQIPLSDIVVECDYIAPEYVTLKIASASNESSINVLEKIKENINTVNRHTLLEQLGFGSAIFKKLQDEIQFKHRVITEQEAIIKSEREKSQAISDLKSQCETALLKNMNEGHKLQEKLREILDQVITLQNSNSALDSRVILLTEEKGRLESEKNDLKEKIKFLTTQVTEAEEKLASLEEVLKEKDSTISKLKNTIAGAWAENDELVALKKLAEAECSTLRRQLGLVSQNLNYLKEKSKKTANTEVKLNVEKTVQKLEKQEATGFLARFRRPTWPNFINTPVKET